MFEMKNGGVPVGQYRAKLTKWEESVHESYGDRVRFVWEIVDGKEKGNEASRFTGAKMTPKSALAKVAAGLSGHKFEPGDSFDPDDYIGKEYLIVVQETDSGSTRVESVLSA